MKYFWEKTAKFKKLMSGIDAGKNLYLSGLTDPAAASLVSELHGKLLQPVLVVVSSDNQIRDFCHSMESFSSQRVLSLPYDDPVRGARAAENLLKSPAPVIVSSIQAVNEARPSRQYFEKDTIEFKRGERVYTRLLDILSSTGYIRAQVVGEPGEFARRGQVIDCWPPHMKRPFRIVFKGDRVTDIRGFEPSDQRSRGSQEKGKVLPYSTDKPEGRLADYFIRRCIVFQSEDFEDTPLLPDKASVITRTSLRQSDIKFSTRPLSYTQSFNTAASEIQALAESRFKIYLASEETAQLNSLIGTLKDQTGVEAEGFLSPLAEGFVADDIPAAILAPGDIFPAKRRMYRPKPPPPHPVEEFSDLKKGDYVVHRKFGVGLFEGIFKKTHSGMISDFLSIKYASDGRLYVAVENADMVQKYIGSKWKTKLDNLSSKTWKKKTRKVRLSVEALARKLIRIYSERSRKGISFKAQEEVEKEFAGKFPYKLTRHQSEAVKETLKDMESAQAMDRLVCGDVGFGKTEVAVRAAFRTVINGFQVALLTPTTVLARQHYNTFIRRFKEFPVLMEHLSRLVSSREQKIAIDKINSGRADIVIGTHRLLNKNINFPSLGLLIIDEEQRFGVEQKEELRYRYKNVDMLTTTATPIPRTLAMAMGKVKGFSMINTPPPGRVAIKTEVMPYSMDTVKDAVNREISRGGQCYFVHNRVRGLKKIKEMLSDKMPEISFKYIHGRMNSSRIASIMDEFSRGDFDVLVSTSIIENGLDLPNVNTMIINYAHRFGLSEIYQMRGRIGRSDIRAYCYLMYPPHLELTGEVRDRLKALESFSALGSGFQLALRDLQIRGAGELLGPRQHGNILKVGFDYYMEILKQEIAKAKGKEYVLPAEVEISLPISAYIPAGYIQDSPLRLAFYRKLSAVSNLEKLKEIKEEMKDRFGKLPLEAKNLIEIINIKLLAARCGIQQLWGNKEKLVFQLASGEKIEIKTKGRNILEAAKKEIKSKKLLP